MNLPQELNLLILGGQSSIGKAVISKLPTSHTIRATYRSYNAIGELRDRTEWISLDLANEESITTFLDKASLVPSNVIINLIGELSGLSINSSLHSISRYFQTYVSNHSFLIEKLFAINSKENFSFVNVSSRAVIYGSNDLYYSEAKSAVHGLTKSLAKLYKNSRCVNLIPGLLKDSNMYSSMPMDIRDDHAQMSGGELMNINQFAIFLVELVEKLTYGDTDFDNKVDLLIGPQYE